MFRKVIWIFALAVILLPSCGVNSNVMFKVPKGEINYDSIPMAPLEDYRISVDDKITFNLSTNDGSEIIDRMSGIAQRNNMQGQVQEFVVRRNGEVELPVIGKVSIAGLTIEECEDTLAYLYSAYQNPFIQVKVTNQRVIVFPGNGSDARVIPLMNTNTTLMEALAQAGGITDRGKANTIKLMRKVERSLWYRLVDH
jgi:polysaccharide export outer membrane protein